MAKGSKSFSFAARLFDAETRQATRLLYLWCRHCDDQIDQAQSVDQARERLQSLFSKTKLAIAGHPVDEIEFQGLSWICQKYQIDPEHPLDLLRGFEMDVSGQRYQSDQDLLLYCYRVAGVVGLMMAKIMGVTDPQILRHAVDAGIAMQMTNIARDVKEDFELGRIYLPETWFQELGQTPVAPPNSLASRNFSGAHVQPVVGRLLIEADRHYRSAWIGVRALPFKMALAVGAALRIYSAIGALVFRRGAMAWDQRAIVSSSAKLLLTLSVLLQLSLERLLRTLNSPLKQGKQSKQNLG